MTIANQIDVYGPSAEAPVFADRLDQYADELASDLDIDKPKLKFHEEPRDRRHIKIANHPLAVAAQRWSSATPDAPADAEAFVAALFRHRWLLLEPVLAEWRVPPRQALRQAADAGLTRRELIELHDAEEVSDEALLAMAENLHPPAVGLIHGPVDLTPDQFSAAARNGAEMAANALGFEVPVPALTEDSGLGRSQFRLRLRKVRGPIEPDLIGKDTATTERAIKAAYMKIGPQLFDAKVLMSRLLDPKAVPPDYARQALRCKPTLQQIVEAVRPLLSEGFLLVDAVLLCEAILASEQRAREPHAGEKLYVLPGLLKPPGAMTPGETPLGAHIRAALVAASLRVKADFSGERTKVSALVLAATTLAALRDSGQRDPSWESRLADRIFAVASGETDVLLVPEDVKTSIRDVLSGRIAGLPIIGPLECPEGIELMQRGRAIAVTSEIRK